MYKSTVIYVRIYRHLCTFIPVDISPNYVQIYRQSPCVRVCRRVRKAVSGWQESRWQVCTRIFQVAALNRSLNYVQIYRFFWRYLQKNRVKLLGIHEVVLFLSGPKSRTARNGQLSLLP